MITETVQRWQLGREHRRPAGEVIRPSEYDVVELGPLEAKAFVREHHYSGECSPTAHPFGLLRRGELGGVAVFGPLPSSNAHRKVFPTLSQKQAVTLGRLVLTDEIPGNGESYFVARCFELLAKPAMYRPFNRDGSPRAPVVAVESCADPEPRHTPDGRRVHRGHVGTVYQALNGRYVGKTNPASLILLPDGTVLSNKAQGKLVRGERGRTTAVAQLERWGATPLAEGEDPEAWLELWRERLTRGMRHRGNHRYLWCLDKRRRREVLTADPRPYPKIDIVAYAAGKDYRANHE
jgi:hypothetical protein